MKQPHFNTKQIAALWVQGMPINKSRILSFADGDMNEYEIELGQSISNDAVRGLNILYQCPFEFLLHFMS